MAAHGAPLSLGFSRQEYWSGLPFPSPYFVLELVISEWGKNKGESLATESYRRFAEEKHWEKSLYMVRISKVGLNLMRQMHFIKEWADAGLDLVPVSWENNVESWMLLLRTDHVNSCVFNWSTFTFDFFPQLRARNKYYFTETHDPIWQEVLKLLQIFDRLFKYQILIELLLTSI